MSQNAMLDRETVTPVADTEPVPVARSRREHLTLMDWDLTANAAAPTIIARGFPPVVAARRRSRYGWSEACVGLLMLASGAACVASLLNL